MKIYSILAATLAQIEARQSLESIQNFVPQNLKTPKPQNPI